MTSSLLFLALVGGILLAAVAFSRRSRRRQLDRIIADWGQPRDRRRRMDSIAAYHRSRARQRTRKDFWTIELGTI
ncbi:MAG: hypothetical protein ACRD15_08650 [Vicinamibacterales bacterium]